jgi:phosphohistidine phosphatase
MRLLVIRHAIAEERAAAEKAGRPDAERALTKAGRRKMQGAAEGLRRVEKRVDVLGSSPLVRAQQTAEIVGAAYGKLAVATVDALKPGKSVKGVLGWVQGQPDDATVALVGHEPQLGILIGWLLTGQRQQAFIDFGKGSACLLEFVDGVQAGRAKLLWMLKPGQLRRLGEKM